MRSALTVLVAITALLSVALLHHRPVMLTLLLALLSIILLASSKARYEGAVFIISGIGGALAESIAISFNAWTYTHAGALMIPAWLILLWGIAGVFITRVSRRLERSLQDNDAS